MNGHIDHRVSRTQTKNGARLWFCIDCLYGGWDGAEWEREMWTQEARNRMPDGPVRVIKQETGPIHWCSATTKKGAPCPFASLPGSSLCHIHDPDGKYRQQHPVRPRAAL